MTKPDLQNFEIPPPHRVVEVRAGDGTKILLRQHGNVRGARIVVSHGNGLSADAYFPFWRHLLDDFEVLVYDLRSHGWNPRGDIERHAMPVFVWDNEFVCDAIVEQLGEKPMFGAFHSLSSLVALNQTLRAGPRWAGLVLFEPPFSPPNGHPMEEGFLRGVATLAERTLARQFRFRSVEAYVQRMRRVPRFSSIGDAELALYARTTLCPAGDEFELICPREFEAKIYATNLDSTIGLSMPTFPVPVKIVAGDPTRVGAEGPSLVCESLATSWGTPYTFVPGTSHFLQFESPELCAREVVSFVSRIEV